MDRTDFLSIERWNFSITLNNFFSNLSAQTNWFRKYSRQYTKYFMPRDKIFPGKLVHSLFTGGSEGGPSGCYRPICTSAIFLLFPVFRAIFNKIFLKISSFSVYGSQLGPSNCYICTSRIYPCMYALTRVFSKIFSLFNCGKTWWSKIKIKGSVAPTLSNVVNKIICLA